MFKLYERGMGRKNKEISPTHDVVRIAESRMIQLGWKTDPQDALTPTSEGQFTRIRPGE